MQVPAVQVSPPLQLLPVQQGCIEAPQAAVQVPMTHARLLPQASPAQQGSVSSPQADWQVPPAQVLPAPVQGTPQLPQCWLLAWRLVSQPLVRLESQSPKPATQLH